MAIASWMESKDVYPGIEAAVRRTEAIETAAKAVVDASFCVVWASTGRVVDVVPVIFIDTLRAALRGEE